jgi:hypothetical protein
MLQATWNLTDKLIEDWYAIGAAANEAVESQLPGRENGPADAYRHLLWGAELTRRFGEDAARRILEDHEIQGTLSATVGRDGQTPEAAAMDRRNNELAIALGKRARIWAEVKEGAQVIIDRSDRSGNGVNGGAVWLERSAWSNHPKDRITGEELLSDVWNWPQTDWINGRVPNPVPYKYPYGGDEHRHEPTIDDPLPLDPEDAAEMNPLSRPVASWSEDDLRRVIASPAYLQPSHPGRARAHAMVREWFAQAEARQPGRIDATGRRVPERARPVSAAGGCEVPVQAHSRHSGKVEVAAHCRSRPAA